jgi:hypothetical protein
MLISFLQIHSQFNVVPEHCRSDLLRHLLGDGEEAVVYVKTSKEEENTETCPGSA